MTDARPGGVGFTSVSTVPDDAVFPFVSPGATAGQKDQDITWPELRAQLGAGGSQAVTATLTGDGTTLTHPSITHNLGTAQLHVLLLEADGQPLTYGNEYSYTATTTTVTVTVDRWGDGAGNSPIPIGVEVSVFVRSAGEAAALDRLPLYTLTGHTATLPTGSGVTANYANEAAFLAAVVPDRTGLACELASGTQVLLLESRWDGSAYYWQEVA